jgi:hypothetical protein
VTLRTVEADAGLASRRRPRAAPQHAAPVNTRLADHFTATDGYWYDGAVPNAEADP